MIKENQKKEEEDEEAENRTITFLKKNLGKEIKITFMYLKDIRCFLLLNDK